MSESPTTGGSISWLFRDCDDIHFYQHSRPGKLVDVEESMDWLWRTSEGFRTAFPGFG
jgi:hypothetical protein